MSQSGTYRRWFFDKIIPWLHEHPNNYAYVFYNMNTYTYILTPFTNIKVLIRLLIGFAKTAGVPLKELFTHVHVFSGFWTASTFATSLQKQGYMDMSSQTYQSANIAELTTVRTAPVNNKRCFSPTEAEEIDQDTSNTRIYIFNSDRAFVSSICLDDVAYDAYFVGTREFPRYDDVQTTALENEIAALNVPDDEKERILQELRSEQITCNSRIVFQCTDIRFKKPIRYFPFATRIYAWETESEKINKGGRYAFVPTETMLGKIQSDCVRQGGSFIGSDHCQTPFLDPIYKVISLPTSLTSNVPYMGNELRNLYTLKPNVGNLGLSQLFRNQGGRRTRKIRKKP